MFSGAQQGIALRFQAVPWAQPLWGGAQEVTPAQALPLPAAPVSANLGPSSVSWSRPSRASSNIVTIYLFNLPVFWRSPAAPSPHWALCPPHPAPPLLSCLVAPVLLLLLLPVWVQVLPLWALRVPSLPSPLAPAWLWLCSDPEAGTPLTCSCPC